MSSSAPRSAAFFDLDKTIIARSSALAFSRPFYRGGLINRRTVLRSAYAQFVFLAGGADHDQMERMRLYLSQLCAGWDVRQVNEIVAEALERIIVPMVYREATALIEDHRAAGRDVVIVSASGSEVVEPIGRLLGAQHTVATRMVLDGERYTGEVAFYAYGPHKADAARDLAAGHGYHLEHSWAYSDSVTDLPLLEAVGHPVAVNPDRALRREAAARGWQVLDFSQPVALRPRWRARLAAAAARAGALAGSSAGAGLVASRALGRGTLRVQRRR